MAGTGRSGWVSRLQVWSPPRGRSGRRGRTRSPAARAVGSQGSGGHGGCASHGAAHGCACAAGAGVRGKEAQVRVWRSTGKPPAQRRAANSLPEMSPGAGVGVRGPEGSGWEAVALLFAFQTSHPTLKPGRVTWDRAASSLDQGDGSGTLVLPREGTWGPSGNGPTTSSSRHGQWAWVRPVWGGRRRQKPGPALPSSAPGSCPRLSWPVDDGPNHRQSPPVSPAFLSQDSRTPGTVIPVSRR